MRLLITCAILTFAFNAHAVTWKRSVHTEKHEDGSTLVVIAEDAIDANLMPRLILRKTFAQSEEEQMIQAIVETQNIAVQKDFAVMAPTNNPLWQVTKPWTEQEEKNYAEWLQKNASEDMLVGGGILVDCADYAIALRWIYSHDHGLPAGNNLIGGRGLLGSWASTENWDKLPTDPDWKKDARFKAALKYLMNFSFTHTVFIDAYPVEITPDFVTPGTIYLTLEGESGHTRTLTNVGASKDCTQSPECMIIIWGNEPADEHGYITEFVPYWLAQTDGGIMRFRWPEQTGGVWQLRDAKQMPGYSEEQYIFSSSEYVNEIATRLGVWNTPESRMTVAGGSAKRLLIQRLAVVQLGYVMCSLVPCLPTDTTYNDYSTPVRDKAINQAIQSFQDLLKNVDPSSYELNEFKHKNRGHVFAGAPFSYYEFLSEDYAKHLNSDPTADYFARWGIADADSDQRTLGLSEVAITAWSKRAAMVREAQDLCFAGGSTTPTCNPADAKVQRLNTSRIDQGLRELRKKLLAVYAQADYSTRQAIDDNFQNHKRGPEKCGSNQDEQCTMYDYMLGKSDPMLKMTSNPDSPYLQRMGF